jgi:hypothetical protein
MLSVSEMPGSFRVCTRMEPSSSLGMNSVPMKNKETAAAVTGIAANPTAALR